MRSTVTLSILLLIIVCIDLYAYKGLKVFLLDIQKDWLRIGIKFFYWLVFAGFAIGLVSAFTISPGEQPYKMYSLYYYMFGFTLLLYLPKLFFIVFELIDDMIYAVQWVANKFSTPDVGEGRQISRVKFLYQAGAIVGAIPFLSVAYGMIKGRFDFRVLREQLTFSNLPKAFDGFKVVQISDAHLGSFFDNYKPVETAIEMVNALEPDIIVFTGDLVNNYSEEAENWIPLFRKFKAKHGKFSVVGNHDYGDYVKWKDNNAKADNFKRLQQIHKEMGFNILMNQGESIDINGEKISLLGVENWGVKPFPQYGDVTAAKADTEETPFKILLSHDPSHWDEVVRKEHSDVDITLSGHTHGMQFGIELGNIKWSPVKYRYPRWGGLYKEGEQYLYVNRGFGYLGFPGRVGMPPEITLLELKTA